MPTSNGFQQIVNNELPPAVPGDFAGANIKTSILAGAFRFVAPPSGCNTGLMGWASPVSGYLSNYYQASSFLGFVHREMQALATAYLSYASTLIPGGDMVTGFNQGDFWGYFPSGATAGQKVYANPTTGALTSAATGGSVTASNPTGTVSANVLTLTGSTTGTIAAGQAVAGGTLPPGTYVVSGSSLTWTLANLDGTPIPNNATNAAFSFAGVQETQFTVMESTDTQATSTASSIAGNILTVGGTLTGTFQAGQYLSGAGIPANCQIVYGITGTGGAGTYYISQPVTASSEAINAGSGLYAKISSWSNVAEL